MQQRALIEPRVPIMCVIRVFFPLLHRLISILDDADQRSASRWLNMRSMRGSGLFEYYILKSPPLEDVSHSSPLTSLPDCTMSKPQDSMYRAVVLLYPTSPISST